jgi:hypothetical protein
MYSLYKNEHRIFKLGEITIRGALRWKGEKHGGDAPIQNIVHIHMEMS